MFSITKAFNNEPIGSILYSMYINGDIDAKVYKNTRNLPEKDIINTISNMGFIVTRTLHVDPKRYSVYNKKYKGIIVWPPKTKHLVQEGVRSIW